ncbi:hypothetical protein DHEL01_v204728 [Diaporthe helianthi]|uniref:Uncharacterized protein n=1 Tax=Diaporthe helianthi TaxID=158607 RepID=A0A2P5I316_DIAHE|nr:hypothetical protein DHEL01_v204728 [Diaporthe helianthi]
MCALLRKSPSTRVRFGFADSTPVEHTDLRPPLRVPAHEQDEHQHMPAYQFPIPVLKSPKLRRPAHCPHALPSSSEPSTAAQMAGARDAVGVPAAHWAGRPARSSRGNVEVKLTLNARARFLGKLLSRDLLRGYTRGPDYDSGSGSQVS